MRDIGAIKSHGQENILAYRLTDILLISLTLLVLKSVYLGTWEIQYILALCIALVAFSIVGELLGVYDVSSYNSAKHSLGPIIFAWFCTIAVLLTIAFMFKATEVYSRIVVGMWFAVVPVSLLGFRFIATHLPSSIKSDSYEQKSIIIGATPGGVALAREIEQNKHVGMKLVGMFDDRSIERLPDNLPQPISGSINDALEMAKERNFRHVYVALPMEASKRIKEIVSYFSDSTARVYIVPDFFTYDLIQSRWRNVGRIPTLSIYDTPFYGFSTFIKRVEDVIVASIILLLISPILLAVSIGVKMSSPGPIIFKQYRYGMDGKKIKVWKFRSMKAMDNGATVKQATKDDPRVTKFGAFIRRTSLDELPQFINVLQGRMSIVGPRPHAVAHNEEYRSLVDKYMLRHKVKPGITGWAQVNGYRGETDTIDKMAKRVEYDLFYIRSWSLWLDIKIIFMTVFKGFIGKTAY
ncbi:undecaprenyl-phosphate glucose phosphotransferase [Vibrio sp. AK197]|uniref:Undecaprenyl-phosphate glucose phosphotransferase n=1 Tax=Vibrio olivae TaxID=1243002 RepID=A0ABV5HNB1_9VIBR